MRMLDLFCGAGGCSVGYHRAGFDDITGVDNKPQKHYPYKFIQADALQYLRSYGEKYNFFHASPPCQRYSKAKMLAIARNAGKYGIHPDLIPPTRKLLLKTGMSYVIECAAGSPLINPLKLFGSQFGLMTQRQRWFEVSMSGIKEPEQPMRRMQTPSAGNGIGRDGSISICGSGGVRGLNAKEIVKYWGMALGGIGWMNRAELAQAIPPIYTEYIGKQIIRAIKETENP